MASPDVHILELTAHEPVDYQTSYMRDLLRWGSTASESGNVSFRDGKLLHPSQSQRAAGSSTFNLIPTPHGFGSFKGPSVLYPIRAEVATQSHLGPLHRLDGYDLPLHGCITYEYTATVEISGHSFRVQIDTGSSTCWVFGDNHRVSKSKNDLQKDIETTIAFDRTQIPPHTSYIPGPIAQCHGSSRFKVQYSDGSHSRGPIYTDLWKFPTLAGSPLAVTLIFGAATEVHHKLALSPIDGVLGLNFLPPFRSFCLKPDGPRRSFLSLGGIPPGTRKPRFWIPVIPDSEQWLLPCHAFGWGADPTKHGFQELTIEPRMQVLVDTGTTLCYFTEQVLDFIYPKLGGIKMKIEGQSKEEYVVPNKQPLDAAHKFIWIKLGKTWIRWSMQIFFGTINEPNTTTGTVWYRSGLLANPDLNIRYSILGAVFLEHINVYFDANINAPKVAFEERC